MPLFQSPSMFPEAAIARLTEMARAAKLPQPAAPLDKLAALAAEAETSMTPAMVGTAGLQPGAMGYPAETAWASLKPTPLLQKSFSLPGQQALEGLVGRLGLGSALSQVGKTLMGPIGMAGSTAAWALKHYADQMTGAQSQESTSLQNAILAQQRLEQARRASAEGKPLPGPLYELGGAENVKGQQAQPQAGVSGSTSMAAPAGQTAGLNDAYQMMFELESGLGMIPGLHPEAARAARAKVASHAIKMGMDPLHAMMWVQAGPAMGQQLMEAQAPLALESMKKQLELQNKQMMFPLELQKEINQQQAESQRNILNALVLHPENQRALLGPNYSLTHWLGGAPRSLPELNQAVQAAFQKSFPTDEEAYKAYKAGTLREGDIITINGVVGQYVTPEHYNPKMK